MINSVDSTLKDFNGLIPDGNTRRSYQDRVQFTAVYTLYNPSAYDAEYYDEYGEYMNNTEAAKALGFTEDELFGPQEVVRSLGEYMKGELIQEYGDMIDVDLHANGLGKSRAYLQVKVTIHA